MYTDNMNIHWHQTARLYLTLQILLVIQYWQSGFQFSSSLALGPQHCICHHGAQKALDMFNNFIAELKRGRIRSVTNMQELGPCPAHLEAKLPSELDEDLQSTVLRRMVSSAYSRSVRL